MAEKKKVTVDKVMTLFRSAENWTDIRQQLVNVNYYMGNQWIQWNTRSRQMERAPNDGKHREVRNKIRPRVNALLSKHVKTRVKFDVVASSKEEADIDAAKAADKYLHYLWNELDMSGKTQAMFQYGLIQKRCWVKTWYDPTAGDDISPTPEDGTIYDDWVESGGKPINQGKICVRVCDPLTIFFDTTAKSDEELKWVIERHSMDIDDIMETYDVDDIVPDQNIGLLANFNYNQFNANYTAQTQNMAMVTELWYKPCSKHPNGLKVTVCNEKIIDYDENAGKLPFVRFAYMPTPGSLWGDAIVTDLIDPQRAINIERSMASMQMKRMGNPYWLLPVDSVVDEDDLNNDIGGIVHYNPISGGKPERIGAPDMPSYFANELNNNLMDIDDMSGSREITQGSLPAGLDTAAGLELMVEQENEKLSVSSQSYERCVKRVMQRMLELIKEHYTEERQARIIGEGNEIEIIRFNGSDLTGSEDINIIPGSSLPELKSAQQGRITAMWTAGAIVNKEGQPDPNKYLRLMGMGDSTELFEEEQLDTNNAKLENDDFEKLVDDAEFEQILGAVEETMMIAQQTGEQIQLPPLPGVPVVWASDDHAIHIRTHNTFRKTSRYRQMPEQIRQLVDKHIAEHEQALNAPMIAQQEQMMQQQQMQQQQAQEQQAQQMQMQQQQDAQKFEQQVALKQIDQDGKMAQTALSKMG